MLVFVSLDLPRLSGEPFAARSERLGISPKAKLFKNRADNHPGCDTYYCGRMSHLLRCRNWFGLASLKRPTRSRRDPM